jgi:hypothetical protein
MFGKQLARLLGGIGIAAALAAVAVPGASAAHLASPSLYDNGVLLHDAYAAAVDRTIAESGFGAPAQPDGAGSPGGPIDLGDAALGGLLGAGLMLLLLGPAVCRIPGRGNKRVWGNRLSAARSAAESWRAQPAPQ